ncbi:hypothetical protein TWF192_010872 [Orbilia oligospora]|nr:hypothetical protein TWF192_010872 [Orbilia oligospora]
MKVFTVCYLGLLAFAPTTLCQFSTWGKAGLDGRVLPKFALEDVTTLTNNIKAEFDKVPKLIGAVDISGNVTFQLQILNKYMENTLFPAVNPQRFKPGTPGRLRARTFKVPGAKENTAIIALTKAAIAEVDRTVNNIRRLWDNLYNKYNSIDFFIYHCKARNNPAGCRNPGEGCPPKPERCPVVCPCYYGFVDGKNPNKDQCFTNEDEIMKVASVSGKSSRASFGWANLKDCRQCFLEDDPLPTCVNVL